MAIFLQTACLSNQATISTIYGWSTEAHFFAKIAAHLCLAAPIPVSRPHGVPPPPGPPDQALHRRTEEPKNRRRRERISGTRARRPRHRAFVHARVVVRTRRPRPWSLVFGSSVLRFFGSLVLWSSVFAATILVSRPHDVPPAPRPGSPPKNRRTEGGEKEFQGHARDVRVIEPLSTRG
jgi:hypothetical protein